MMRAGAKASREPAASLLDQLARATDVLLDRRLAVIPDRARSGDVDVKRLRHRQLGLAAAGDPDSGALGGERSEREIAAAGHRDLELADRAVAAHLPRAA